MSTPLQYTVFRVGNIGGKRYVIGLHPKQSETLLSIRELGRRTGYVLPLSTLRVHAALAFGRAEQTAKKEARKAGVPWKRAKRKFLSTVIPPTIKQPRKKNGEGSPAEIQPQRATEQ